MKMAINQTKITPIINLKNIFSTMAINDGDIHRSNLALDEQKMEMGHTNKGTFARQTGQNCVAL